MAGMLEGKIVLVTGAARGIGRGSALLFAREGAQLAVADISTKGVEETAELIVKAGGKAIAVGADVSRSSDVSAMMETVLKAYGRVDCAIKNPRSKLRGIGGRKEADQKNAASCGEYVPKEIQQRGYQR